MNSIISKLSEIETAATAIVKHAESEKDRLDQKMQKEYAATAAAVRK